MQMQLTLFFGALSILILVCAVFMSVGLRTISFGIWPIDSLPVYTNYLP